MEMTIRTFTPSELLVHYQSLRDDVSSRDFFNNPEHSKTQEIWCAAQFGLGYQAHISECQIRLEDEDAQTEVDFELLVSNRTFPFQITEVQELGRRRGDEYKKEDKNANWRNNDGLSGTDNNPILIKSAIDKKAKKLYANSKNLNLLVYVNLATSTNYDISSTKKESLESLDNFASVWLFLDIMAICSLKGNREIGFIPKVAFLNK